MEDAYERCHIEFIDYIARNFGIGMAQSAVHAESLVNIVEQEMEGEFEKLTEEV